MDRRRANNPVQLRHRPGAGAAAVRLNLGFAQSEAISFRRADILRDEAPPHIRRVRRKTGKLFKASLWAETIKGLDWLAA